MPAGFFVDGKLTYRPLVSVITEFAGRPGLTPANKVLAVVGDFPFLQKDIPYLFMSQTSFLSAVPVNGTMRELANIIYNPSTAAPFAGSPAGVILLNAQPNTQATAYIADVAGALQAVKLVSNVWGQAGNATTFRISEGTDGSRLVTVTNRGASETFNAASGANVINIQYAHPNASVNPTTIKGLLGSMWDTNRPIPGSILVRKPVGSGNTTLSFTRAINESFVRADAGGPPVWIPDVPVDGKLQVSPSNVTFGGAEVTVSAVGTDKSGDLVTGTAVFTNETPKYLTKTVGGVTSDVEFSTVTSVKMYASSGTIEDIVASPNANFLFSGDIATIGQDSGQETCAQAIQFLNNLTGFIVTTESFRASSTLFKDLDAVEGYITTPASGANPGASEVVRMGSARRSLVQAINSNSTLIKASDEVTGGPRLELGELPFGLTFSGGTQSPTATTDWLSSFAALTTSPVTVLVPYTNNHGVHVAALDHARLMWGKGQRECQLVVAPAPRMTLTELNAKRRDLQDFRVTMLPHSIRISQWDGSTSAYSTLYTALMFAAMQCANSEVGLPMGGARPRALAFDGHSTVMGTDAADTLLGNCMTPLEDLGDGIKVVRWVTTYSEDDDLVRTEGSSVEAVAFSNIGVRNAVRPFLNTKATPAVAPAIRSIIAAELADQVYRGILRAWQPDSLIVEETATSFLARYTISPVLPVNHIAVTSVAIAFPIA